MKKARLNRSGLVLGATLLAIALAGCGAAPAPASSTPAPAPTSVPGGAPTGAPASAPTSNPPTAMPPTPAVVAAPTSAPAPPATATPQAQPGTSEASNSDAAVEVVAEYYQAIADRAYERAYRLWAQGGAASGQTLDQFQQGFADTAGVSLRLGMPKPAGDAVSVPIALASVVNLANQGQEVRHFEGAYTLRTAAGGWRIASANIAAVDAGPQPPADVADPDALLRAYYAAINAHDYGRAYTYWSNNGVASQQSYAQFAAGFAKTAGAQIDLGKWQANGAAGSTYAEVPAVIVASQSNGSQQAYCGTYTLRHLNVPPFDQFGWHIEQAAIAPVANVQLGSDQARRLLENGCK